MPVYVNPANGHSEDSSLACIWALLFGTFFFMAKGIWRHVVIQLVLFIFFLSFLPAAAIFLAVIAMMLVYAVFANEIVERYYLREGYRLESPGAPKAVSDYLTAMATAECESSQRQDGLWARAYAQAGGDEDKAKAAYIAERVQAMAAEATPQPPPR